MSKTSRFLKVSGVFFALILSSSAFAEVEPYAPADTLGAPAETDAGLGLRDANEIQDLDQSLSKDPEQVSDLFIDKIRTTQAMHAGDEEVSEPVSDEF